MENLDNYLLKSFNNYQKDLHYKGIISKKEACYLNTAFLLRDLVTDYFGVLPTEQEHRFIMENFRKLSQCSKYLPSIVSFKDYGINVNKDLKNRLYEDSDLQFTEEGLLKLLN